MRVVPAGLETRRQLVAQMLQNQGFFFSLSKLIYDPKEGSCRTGQTVSTILKHESKKKVQDETGMVRWGSLWGEAACPG